MNDLDALFDLTVDMSERDLHIVSRVIEAVYDMHERAGAARTLAALDAAISDVGLPLC